MVDNYDGITAGTKLTELELQNKNVNMYNDSLVFVPTGIIGADTTPELEAVWKNASGSSVVETKNNAIIPNQEFTVTGSYYINAKRDVIPEFVFNASFSGTGQATCQLKVARISGATFSVPITVVNGYSLNADTTIAEAFTTLDAGTPTEIITSRKFTFDSTNQTKVQEDIINLLKSIAFTTGQYEIKVEILGVPGLNVSLGTILLG
jgi:hypothetical protein